MALTAGDRLGHYEILATIGAGGMGEVYRARDTKLDRDVAIKVLPAAVARDPERLARFDREAKVLAALNHPNIAAIYGLEDRAIVMELVEGPTLAERIQAGPLDLKDALGIALGIADALETAHEKGIVHRDLKPANVKAPVDGMVKVLDLGLATALPGGDRESSNAANSPTLTMGATEVGVILGTAAYMSPEQASGKRVDKRADIWSYGVVLFEMLTGKRLFEGGETVSHTLADVLRAEVDLKKLPAGTPAPIRDLLKRCLDRDVKARLRDIGEARLTIQRWLASPVEAVPEYSAAGKQSRLVPWAAAGVLATLAGIALWAPWRAAPVPVEPVRFEISAPPKAPFTNWMTLSPDGRTVAFTVRAGGTPQLWLRPLGSIQAKPLTTTANSPIPFWSPDSRYIAYQFNGKLLKIEVAGGPPQPLCDAPSNNAFGGGSWNRDGVIIFGTADGLMRVSSSGGIPAKLTLVDAARKETAHRTPMFLPDGKHFIYFRQSSAAENSGIYVGSLDDAPERQSTKALLLSIWNGLFAPSQSGGPGYLLFKREGTLMAQPFDPGTLALSGEPAPVADPVGTMANTYANAAVSQTGVLAYKATGQADQRTLTWYDRSGTAMGTLTEPGVWANLSLSPDGSRVASMRAGGVADIQVVDIQKKLVTRFTFDKAEENFPIWSPDGSQIVFSSSRSGVMNLYRKVSNGARDEELLLETPEPKHSEDWSRDGRYLLFSAIDPKNREDLWYLPMQDAKPGAKAAAKPEPVRFIGTGFREDRARFSPDGRFVAYTSDESGNPEVYVRSFPDGNGRWQVSRGGGNNPRWRRDGKELYFTGPSGLYAVAVTTGTTFQADAPKLLFPLTNFSGLDVSADGKLFLAATASQEAEIDPIIVVMNWQTILKK